MYLCQTYKGLKLGEIAKIFDLNNVGSVSSAIFIVKEKLAKGDFKEEVDAVKNDLYLIQRI